MGKESHAEIIAELSAKYDTPGKRKFTALILDLAARDDCRTYGTFWGGGGDARLAVAAGLDVTATEIDRSLHGAMREDAETVGYAAFPYRASRLTERVDIFHADFCGNASPGAFHELRRLANVADRWLAVTLSPDHQLDPSMQGEAALFTVPAWLVGATGLTIEYVSRYTRNGKGQTMWVALLQRREGNGNSHRVQPLQISWSVRQRKYWASVAMYREFPGLFPHTQPVSSWEKCENTKARYWAKHEEMRAKASAYYRANAQAINAKMRKRRESDPEVAEAQRIYQRKWHASNRERYRAPEKLAHQREYRRQWYLAHREEQIAYAAAWRQAHKHASPLPNPSG